MKVIVYIGAWGSGGIEAYYVTLFKHLRNTDIDFSVVCYKKLEPTLFEQTLKELGVPIVYQSEDDKLVSPSKQVEFLMNEIERQKADIVHMNLSTGKSFYFARKIEKKFPAVSVIHHAHGDRIGVNSLYTAIRAMTFNFWKWLYEKDTDFRIGCSKQILDWAYNSKITYRGGGKITGYSL